ncbi:MAG: polymer-forming cytoskeletal protein [Acidobacteriia bacterium]|nr:polymer-forming cytoskeletal protein [Terriglobia bacterium]MBV8902382.1 polymer-forming cytoskeletal protein [Terriglobia bacterium]MBV9746575.1 polymer-forming cytoskeletal protein [Terriglobia bacterium]
MWNKRREEELPRPATPPPTAGAATVPLAPNPVEVKKEATTVSTTPIGRIDSESRGSAATIGKAVKVVGQIYSKEDLFVDGDLEGTVEALEHKLTIGPNGTVHASVKAREVVVLGTIQGNVEATDKIEIRKDAKLVGDIKTARIIIEDGAYFKGSIDIVKPEPAKVSPKPQPAPAVMTANQMPVTAAVEAKR